MMKRQPIAKAHVPPVAARRVPTVDQHARSKSRVQEEIELLRTRLKQIGPDGDCGYEKALIRFFNEQIELRLEQLAAYEGSGE